MRKMNKIVALSLVLAMALSMMAGAASFKDQATINAELIDEINLLVNLGVYSENGTGAGYFEPNGTITRSQAAKIIYVLKNKGVDNGATSWTGLNIFNDVEVGSWYEGYVNYCASVGIIAGTGDNNFTPNGQLTGVELAKMLLVVIGYKADLEGYTGAKWDANILADAEAAGIFEGYELPVRGVVTREWAAQMIVNALNATKVKYEDGAAVEMYNSLTNEPITYAEQDLNLDSESAVLVKTPNIAIDNAANNTNGKNKLSKIEGFAEFEYDADPALLGQKVTVLFKGNSLASADKIYGVTAHEDVVTLDTTVDAVSYDADDFNDTLVLYTDYVTGSVEKANDGLKNFFAANDGRAIKLIDNGNDGKWDAAHVASVVYDEVDYINTTNNVLRLKYTDTFDISDSAKADRTEKWEKVNFVDTIAKGDIVKVTKDYSTGVEVAVIELVDVVTGAVTKVVNGSNPTYTIDGETYQVAANKVTDFSVTVDTKARDYFVDAGYIVYTAAIAGDALGQTNIAYVVNYATVNDGWGDTTMVDVLKNDGTREKLTYKVPTNADETAIAWENVPSYKGQLVEFVMNNGKVYFNPLASEGDTKIENTTANTSYKFDKSEMQFTNGTNVKIVNEDTYFFVKDGSTYAVMTGDEIVGDMNAAGGNQYAYNINGLPYLRYAVLEGDIPTGAESKGSAIAAATVTTEFEEDGDKIHKLEVTKLDGTPVTLVALASENEFDGMTGKMVKYNVNTDGYATVALWTVEDGTYDYAADAISHIEGNAVMLKTAGYKELASDVKMYFVDAYKSGTSEKIMVSEGDAIVEAADDLNGNLVNNVLYKLNADGEISAIIVEVDGEAIWTSVYGN